MSIRLTEYVFNTLKVYPRVHYFVERILSIHERFLRVIGTFPKEFHNEEQIQEISSSIAIFNNKQIKVIVVGNAELIQSTIVVMEKPLQEQIFLDTYPLSITVLICYLKLDSLKNDKAILEAALDTCIKMYVEHIKSLFVVIDITTNCSDSDQADFCKIVQAFVTNVEVNWNYEERCIIGSGGVLLGSKIQEMLEKQLIIGLYQISDYLNEFVRQNKNYGGRREDEIIKNDKEKWLLNLDMVKDKICKIIYSRALDDIKTLGDGEESPETMGLSLEDKFVMNILKKLATIIKCSIIVHLSETYNLPVWLCNLLLEQTEFEKKCVSLVSESNRQNLKKLYGESRNYDVKLQQNEMFEKVRYHSLASDIMSITGEVQKTMISTQRVIEVMTKMIFEINGCLSQTVEARHLLEPNIIPTKLKDEIVKLDDIYGCGTIYGQLEIHVKSDSNLDTARQSINDLLKKNNFWHPYKLRIVSQPARIFANIQHEHGKLIKSTFPELPQKYREGTLGGFVLSEDKKLYGLTCAHVVGNLGASEHNVYIVERKDQLEVFGVSTPNLTILSGNMPLPLVDIAAVLINEDITKHCIRYLRDDSGVNRKAILSRGPLFSLAGKSVYKYGAISNFTRGIICSSDYQVTADEKQYLLMIEPPPGHECPIFAKPGDSGSIVCLPLIDSETSEISAVSMINGGDLKFACDDEEAQNYNRILSFYLEPAINMLQQRAHVCFNLP